MVELKAVDIRTSQGKKWLGLPPDLMAALEPLAEKDGLTLAAFISVLINEALAHRLQRRDF